MILKIIQGEHSNKFFETTPKEARKAIIANFAVPASEQEKLDFKAYKKELKIKKSEAFAQKHTIKRRIKIHKANVEYVENTKDSKLTPEARRFKIEHLERTLLFEEGSTEKRRQLYNYYKAKSYSPKGEDAVKLMNSILKEFDEPSLAAKVTVELGNETLLASYGKSISKPYLIGYFKNKNKFYKILVFDGKVELHTDPEQIGTQEYRLKYGELSIMAETTEPNSGKWIQEQIITHEGTRELKLLRYKDELIGIKIGNATKTQ